MDKKKLIFDILESEIHGVIATVGEDGKPEAALVGFGQTQDLVLIFGTSDQSRKYKNIMRNPKVAFVIGGWRENSTIQYEGTAIEIRGEERKKMTEIYFKKVPGAASYEDLPDERYFKVIPSWIRCTGYLPDEDFFELKF